MSKWSAWPCNEIKDLSEIRQRHARDESRSSLWDNNPYVMHRDREWLLAEVERLRGALRDIERGDYSDPMCERTPEQRARDALEANP